MDFNTGDGFLTAIGSLVTGLLGAAYYVRRQKPVLAKDNLAVEQVEADISVIKRLREEGDRLSVQNGELARMLNQFQLQLLTFQTENQKLSLENNALREENISLREEIVQLRKESLQLRNDIAELTTMVVQLQQRKSACEGCEHS